MQYLMLEFFSDSTLKEALSSQHSAPVASFQARYFDVRTGSLNRRGRKGIQDLC